MLYNIRDKSDRYYRVPHEGRIQTGLAAVNSEMALLHWDCVAASQSMCVCVT